VEETDGLDVRTAPAAEPAAGAAVEATAPAERAAPPYLLDRTFDRDEITLVRHQITERLVACGLDGEKLQGFVLAINEVVTNVVLHAGGHGRLVLRRDGGSVHCTVTDSGPGIPEPYRRPPEVPEAFEVGGRGIWLAYQLCDEVTVATGPIGTTIGLRVALPGNRPSREEPLVNGLSAEGRSTH
jgi:anti-sigma regulatory factor (Ser/Thr protein kinase)